MTQRKNMSELGLGFYSDGTIILHPSSLHEIQNESPEVVSLAQRCHIYLILKRPRVSFVPNSIEIREAETVGKLRYLVSGVEHVIQFRLEGKANADRIEISAYPHAKMSLVKDEVAIFTIPAHLLSLMCEDLSDASVKDLEVVYVGKSYGDGSRSARDRLLNHATLQKVLSDINQDDPDAEALLLLVEYCPPQIMVTMDSKGGALSIESDRDVAADIRRQCVEITEALEISIIEAGLIRYFEPPYNEKYKLSFPSQDHRILESAYNIDYSAITVEINTEQNYARLYSAKIAPGHHHVASFDLHDPKVRQSLFNVFGKEEGPTAEDFSGPIF